MTKSKKKGSKNLSGKIKCPNCKEIIDEGSTFCPECGERLIHRTHFQVLKNDILEGKCKFCGHKIPGIWR